MRLSSVVFFIGVLGFIGTGLAQTGSSLAFTAQALRTQRIHGPVVPVHQTAQSMRYIVLLKGAPIPLYRGGVSGLQATNPQVTGARHLDTRTTPVRKYLDYLKAQHSAFLEQADTALGRTLKPRFQYHYALNGMVVNLTRMEAARLARMPDVQSVQPVRYYRPTTSTPVPAAASYTNASRAWIGAPDVWSIPTFDTGIGQDNEGEGVVLADVDTGINAANLSFAATSNDPYMILDPLGSGKYLGVCDSSNTSDGTLANTSGYPQTYQAGFHCNDKLIGAYTFTLAAGKDPNSPEDSEGHGSHTASIAAGDFVNVTLSDLNVTTAISGVAPHANIIAYDVCDPVNQCGTDSSVAAVEQAIKDQSTIKAAAGSAFKGMVLNYSIGGGEDPYTDPVEQAFLAAVEAGIYVSASGGNGGPGNASYNDPADYPQYPVEHLGPWVASTAATTHNGLFQDNGLTNFTAGDVATLASIPTTINGEAVSGALPTTTIVYAGETDSGGAYAYEYANYPGGSQYSTSNFYSQSGENYPDPTFSNGQAVQECLYPFPVGTFPSGSIVVCDRGDIPLVDKADNVYQGGAAGIVIVSQSGNALIAEPYEIPATMIAYTDGATLEAWLTQSYQNGDYGASPPDGTPQAEILGVTPSTDDSVADEIADFSSRGPTDSDFDNLVKPDLAAPGVSVLAAYANPAQTDAGGANQPETYEFLDGTSMASPHDTGAAALLMQLHPDWSPSEIKSALMLTAVTAANGTSPGLTDQCASLDSSNNCIAGTSVPSPQVRGAGRIDVSAASRSGIVLDETGSDYAAADPSQGGDLTTLNLAGLANNDCINSCSWTRTLSSGLNSTTANYSIAVTNADSGLKVTVSPTTFSLAPGASQKITVTADVSGLPLQQWSFAQLDIDSSSNGDDGQPLPALHMPMMVERQEPEPAMSVAPASLSISVVQKQTATKTLTISNTGIADLDWSFSKSNPTPVDGIWDQPDSGSDQGYPSGFFTVDNAGVYSADHFTMPLKGKLTKIMAEGFAEDGTSPADLNQTVRIDWYIYPTTGSVPAGDPANGSNNYLWHYGAPPSGAGIAINNGTITLDLAAAGQSDVSLSPGTYWLMVVPTFNSRLPDVNGTNGATWYWLEGTSTDGQKDAYLIDPTNSFGGGTGWQAIGSSLAFTLTGTLDCSGSVSGLSFSETQGVVKASASTSVTVTFNAQSASVGSYNTALCVTGNDPDHALTAVPVSIGVTAASSGSSSGSSSGGGGGSFGLLVLLGLGLTGLKRLHR